MIALYLAIHLVIYLFVHAQKKVDGKIKRLFLLLEMSESMKQMWFSMGYLVVMGDGKSSCFGGRNTDVALSLLRQTWP